MHFSGQRRPAERDIDVARRRPPGLVVAGAILAATIGIAAPASAGQSAVLSSFASPLTAGAPTVTKLHPNAGLGVGGTSVTIGGTNLSGATEVHFGSTSASFTSKSAGSMKAVAPPGTGTVDVTVTTPAGTSALSEADRFTYEPATPTIERLAPAEGPTKGNQKIRIIGTNFKGATSVLFGSTPSPKFAVSNPGTTITAVDPPGLGAVDVRVTTPEGTSPTTPGDVFSYLGRPPEVSRVSPSKGPAGGGASVSISGLNFFGASAVHFESVDAPSFTVNSDESITATSPAETVGTVNVTVTTPYGTSSFEFCGKNRPCAIQDHYKFKEPTVTSLTPSSGPAAGGTSVTVSGSGFAPGTSDTTFQFGHTLVTSAECTSSAACTIVTPPHKAGTEDLQVKVSPVAETSKKTPADRFTFE